MKNSGGNKMPNLVPIELSFNIKKAKEQKEELKTLLEKHFIEIQQMIEKHLSEVHELIQIKTKE
jgi:hypothetical protein